MERNTKLKNRRVYPLGLLLMPLLLMGLSFDRYSVVPGEAHYLVGAVCSPLVHSSYDRKRISVYLQEAADEHSVDVELLAAVMAAESQCRVKARSRKGAIGLMQLMPSTARWLGVNNPHSLRDNVFGGAKYLSMLMKDFNGNLELTLAAYNSGPNKVRRYKKVPPIKETRLYVKKVMKYYDRLKDVSWSRDV